MIIYKIRILNLTFHRLLISTSKYLFKAGCNSFSYLFSGILVSTGVIHSVTLNSFMQCNGMDSARAYEDDFQADHLNLKLVIFCRKNRTSNFEISHSELSFC